MLETNGLMIRTLDDLAVYCYGAAKAKGFWDDEPVSLADAMSLTHYFGNKLMLIVGELSEAHEGLRKGNGPSDHIPEFSALEEELADVLIRVFDLSGRLQLRLNDAVRAKLEFNRERPFKHGKKF